MWFDTHCHLDAAEFDGDREAVAERARSAGVERLLVPGVEVTGLDATQACCDQHPGCLPGYGIHPLYVYRAESGDLDRLRTRIAERRPVALGEIGLDGFVPGNDMARQIDFFSAQLRIARDYDLPVVLHIRRAQDLVLRELRRAGVRRGFAHAFNGSVQQADAFIALGFRLGFGGAMTFPRATRIRQLAASLPLEAVVLETDSPDIPPVWLSGGRNEPAVLPAIGAVLAELRGERSERIASETRLNALETLGLDA